MAVNQRCWIAYAERLRKDMYREKCFELTVSVASIHDVSGTDVPLQALQTPSFWESRGTLTSQGVLLDFEVNREGKIDEVTFRLDEKRRGHLQRVIERVRG